MTQMRRLLATVCFITFGSWISQADQAVPLRVMSWNIHHGANEQGKIVIEEMAAYIKSQNPDVVVLQEVDQACERSGNVDQAKKLGELTGLHASFGAAFDFQGGKYGQAILSRYPISDLQVHRLPSADETRVLIHAQVETPHGPWFIAGVHLDASRAQQRHVQAQLVAQILGQVPRPVVLGGDFNATPEEATMKVFTQAPWSLGSKAGAAATSPAVAPLHEIDHLILRGLRFERPITVLPEDKLSDHRPLFAEIALPSH